MKRIFLIFLFILVSCNVLSAKTLVVDDNYPSMCENGTCRGFFCLGKFGRFYNYKRIKDAIKDAKSGDIIKICKGNYNESVVVDKDDLTITSGADVNSPLDVNWYYRGTVVNIGSWAHSAKNFKIENVSITSERNSNSSKGINILKATGNIIFQNLNLKALSGVAIYSGFSVDKTLNYIFKNITFNLSKANAFKLEQGNNVIFSNITINSSKYKDSNTAIFFGWGFNKNSYYNFENLKLNINRGRGIEISEGKNVIFNFFTLKSSSAKGIYINSGVKGDISFDNVSIYTDKDYGIYINEGKDINMKNISINGDTEDSRGIKLNWGVVGDYKFYNVNISVGEESIYIAKGIDVLFDNVNVLSKEKKDFSAIKFDWSNFSYITIKNSSISSGGTGITVNGANSLVLDKLKVISYGDNGIKINSNVNNFILKNSCIFNNSDDDESYGININNWRRNRFDINNNCIYSLNGYFARDSKRTDNWNSNFWNSIKDRDGDGDIDYVDSNKIGRWVRDTSPLKSCNNGCNGAVNLAKPLVDYRMDKCFWNGTEGEVIDSSGNKLNATAVGGANTVKSSIENGGICRVAKLTGANDYLYAPINNQTLFNATKKYISVSAWVKFTSFDEENQIIYIKANTPNRPIRRFVRRNQRYFYFSTWRPNRVPYNGIYIGVMNSNGTWGRVYYSNKQFFKLNQWYHVVGVVDTINGRIKVYINGRKVVETKINRGEIPYNATELWIGETPEKFQKFNGYIDEVKIFDTALTDSEVEKIYTNEKDGKNWDGENRECNSCNTNTNLDHIEIIDKGGDHSAIACEPELVCFTAKDKDNNTLTNYTGEIYISSLLGNVYKGEWYKSFSGYSNDDSPTGILRNEGTSKVSYYINSSDNGDFCLFLSNKNIIGNSEKLKVVVDSNNGNIENNYSIEFFKSAFKLSWEKESLQPWEKQISCLESDNNPKVDSKLYLIAITTNNRTGACETLNSRRGRAVYLKSRILYVEPSNVVSPALYVNGKKINYHNSDNPDTWDNIRLRFINGKAPLNLKYYDAGKLKLQFAYDLDRRTPGYEMETVNSNNEITFSPFGIYIDFQNIDYRDSDNIGSFNTKLRAGRDYFKIRVRGVCYDPDDDTSPKDGVPDINADLSNNRMPLKNFRNNIKINYTVAKPLNGSGKLSVSEIKESNFNSGVGTVNATFSDVGILKLTSANANNYINLGNTVIGWPTHKYIGRFIPDHFAIESKVNGILQENCDTFNYTGDTLTYLVAPSFKIIAENKDDNVTRNYRDEFNFLTLDKISISYPSKDDNQFGNSREIEISILPASGNLISNGDGTFKYTFGNDKIVYLRNNNSKISPFAPKFSIKVESIQDNDSVLALNLPFLLTVSGQSMRYGKVKILDNYGPEIENLKMKLRSFFWNNGNWQFNDKDSCTHFVKTDFIFKNFTQNLNSGETSVINVDDISNGVGYITLSAPGKNNFGSVDVDFKSNLFLHDNDSAGTATFGIYRGRDRIIMWEEVPSKK